VEFQNSPAAVETRSHRIALPTSGDAFSTAYLVTLFREYVVAQSQPGGGDG